MGQGEACDSEVAVCTSRLRTFGRVVGLVWLSLLAGCTSHVSEDLNVEALGNSGDAVIVMAAVLDRVHQKSCMRVRLQTSNGQTPSASSGQRVASIKLGSGTMFDQRAEVLGSAQIAPGTYKIAAATCDSPTGGKLDVLTVNPRGFATFTVSAGEVVNLGKLIILEVEADPASFMQPARYVYVSAVAPLETDPRTVLNKELAARLIDRTMVASEQSLPKAELARICQRNRAVAVNGKANSAACTLAGL